MKRSVSVFWLCVAFSAACGGAPERASSPASHESGSAPVRSRAEAPEACAQEPGKPPPEPLAHAYTGLAAKARCQNEVYAIMGNVSEDLGVACSYCHLDPDFSADTERKRIANWMASELAPSLRKRDGGAAWCNDCHMMNGHGVAKILGEPRSRSFATEWMLTRLVEDFETRKGAALHCQSCHVGNLGTSEFQSKVTLTNHLPKN